MGDLGGCLARSGEYTGDSGGSVEVVCWSVVLVLGSGASSTSTKWVASGFSATGLCAAGVPGLIVVQCGCSDEVNRMG